MPTWLLYIAVKINRYHPGKLLSGKAGYGANTAVVCHV